MPTCSFATSFASPLGIIRIEANERGVTAISFAEESMPTSARAPAFLRDARRQLQEYFAGERRCFEGMPLQMQATDFQERVWRRAQRIPFGKTINYGELAEGIAAPRASRAVGTALGRNAHAIIIPCHRVVASSGARGGYAGGQWRKEWLLGHERKTSMMLQHRRARARRYGT